MNKLYIEKIENGWLVENIGTDAKLFSINEKEIVNIVERFLKATK